MSLYLNTRGKATVAVGICDRCRFKAPLSDLVADGNSPALRVHPRCSDAKDPYKLPPRKSEIITLQHPRPEEPLTS